MQDVAYVWGIPLSLARLPPVGKGGVAHYLMGRLGLPRERAFAIFDDSHLLTLQKKRHSFVWLTPNGYGEVWFLPIGGALTCPCRIRPIDVTDMLCHTQMSERKSDSHQRFLNVIARSISRQND